MQAAVRAQSEPGGVPLTENQAVRVLVVDDQLPFRRAAKAVLAVTAGFEVAGEAESGEDAVSAAESLHPDLVLMDINLPGINGLEATQRITGAHPDIVVILLSTYTASDLPGDARTCGAIAYVNKEEFGPALLQDLWAHRDRPAWDA
jgi:two-component system, NarL family, invasion response regulator UvrY